jgi:hypothetical protein
MTVRQIVVTGLVLHGLCTALARADAGPTARQLEEHRATLEAKLAGQGFTVIVEKPFVVIGDESPRTVKNRASGFFRWTVTLLEKDWFPKRPNHVIEVWLFKNTASYRKGAKKFFDDEPETPYGYYSPGDRALVMNIGLGAGTLSHELVHPYMEANFPDGPAWFNEGVASLYEQPRERNGRLWGTTNWRLPQLQKQIRADTLPSLRTMMSTSSAEFYDANYDAYAMARFLCQYLQDHGKIQKFYQTFLADEEDRSGVNALVAVLGQDLESFDAHWRSWVKGLRR